ncbi:hypothetical protein DENSPDRAFT_335271 [Dentipellis sp. KUC8613]|nr:hypothetical protein DENSPDRAFT_335271 [Dentipellis sp. KUC8613]
MSNSPSDQEPPVGDPHLAASPRRSKRHYVFDELIVFQVEDTLFRVHRSALEDHSPVFKDMFALGPTESNPGGKEDESSEEGKSDDKPIILAGVTTFEFETLLDEIYSIRMRRVRIKPLGGNKGKPKSRSRKYSLTLLAVAHRYQVTVYYPKVIADILADEPPLADLDVIAIAEEFNVPLKHIQKTLFKLVQRPESLSGQEMESRRFSFDLLAKIVEAREKYKGLQKTWPLNINLEKETINIVNKVFGTAIQIIEQSPRSSV